MWLQAKSYMAVPYTVCLAEGIDLRGRALITLKPLSMDLATKSGLRIFVLID